MYKVKVNDQFQYDIEDSKAQLLEVNGKETNLNISNLDANHAHILFQNKSFNTEIVKVDKNEKTCKIKVNGNIYQVKLEDQFDQLLQQLGLDKLAANKVLDIKAPMPGLVLKVMIENGTEVKKGDNLLILEAMKMENILKSTTDGIVKRILIAQGDKVEKNQILIQFA